MRRPGCRRANQHSDGRTRFVDDRLLDAAQRSVRQLLRQEVPAIVDLRDLEEYEEWLRPLLITVARRARANHSGFSEVGQPPREIPPIPAESRVPAHQIALSHLAESLIRGVRTGFAQVRLAPIAPLVAAAVLLIGGGTGLAARGPFSFGAVLGALSQTTAWVGDFVSSDAPIFLPPTVQVEPPADFVTAPPVHVEPADDDVPESLEDAAPPPASFGGADASLVSPPIRPTPVGLLIPSPVSLLIRPTPPIRPTPVSPPTHRDRRFKPVLLEVRARSV